MNDIITPWRHRLRAVVTALEAREPVASVLRIRLHRPLTFVLGPQYRPNLRKIEIDITYSCFAACYHCDRSCRQAPTNDRMSPSQVAHFVQESIAKNRKWEQIAVLGGEPTTHPDLPVILGMLLDYRKHFSPDTHLVFKSNGFGPRVQERLKLVPPEFEICNSGKSSSYQAHFSAFNIAPIDVKSYRRADFTNGCSIPSRFGCGLTPYGYYACPVMGGGIDRIVGFDAGKKGLPLSEDAVSDQLKKFCPLCGHFRRRESVLRLTDTAYTAMSATWEKAYAAYAEKPPALSRYG